MMYTITISKPDGTDVSVVFDSEADGLFSPDDEAILEGLFTALHAHILSNRLRKMLASADDIRVYRGV